MRTTGELAAVPHRASAVSAWSPKASLSILTLEFLTTGGLNPHAISPVSHENQEGKPSLASRPTFAIWTS